MRIPKFQTGFWRSLFVTFSMPLVVLALPALAPAKGNNDNITFSKDIAPIFQAKCQECHQPNSIAPMSLITYKDARPWAKAIRERVITRQMPPWHIDPLTITLVMVAGGSNVVGQRRW